MTLAIQTMCSRAFRAPHQDPQTNGGVVLHVRRAVVANLRRDVPLPVASEDRDLTKDARVVSPKSASGVPQSSSDDVTGAER